MESAKLLVTADLLRDFDLIRYADSLSATGQTHRSTPGPHEAFSGFGILQAGHICRYRNRKLLFLKIRSRLWNNRREHLPEHVTLLVMLSPLRKRDVPDVKLLLARNMTSVRRDRRI